MTTRTNILVAIATAAFMVSTGGAALGADVLAPNYDQTPYESQAGADDLAQANEPSRVPGALGSVLIGFDSVVDIIRHRRFNAPDIFTMTGEPAASDPDSPDPCTEGGTGTFVFCGG